jgi:NADH dehydrogenase
MAWREYPTMRTFQPLLSTMVEVEMILIAGGTGLLGTQVVRLLDARRLPVRVFTREVKRAARLTGDRISIAEGNAGDPEAVASAVAGVRTVISAMQGFAGPGATSPEAVDWQGNVNLIRAAAAARVEHFVLVSIQGARTDHPIGLFQMKARAEDALRSSGLGWTILRPTAFMELWARLIGEPLVATGKTTIFGRGQNPINFVSVHDVARFVELAVVNTAMRGVTLDIGGPENLTFNQVAEIFQRETGHRGTVKHVPRPMMRVASVVVRAFNPILARLIQAGVVMDTEDMTFNAADLAQRFPSIPQTTLAEVVKRDFVVGDR